MVLSWLTPSIKKFFSETFPFIIHNVKEVLPGYFNRAALPVMTTCCSASYANFDEFDLPLVQLFVLKNDVHFLFQHHKHSGIA